MHRSASKQLEQCDIIVPVPLHWRRLGKRRFNQAAILAHELSKRCNVPVSTKLLTRTRHTPPQGHLSRMARQKNLQGAFEATEDCIDKSIMLIDDVLTTGATLLNCTNKLLRAGAKEVHVLTVARVVHSQTQ
jgi:ComF family protein